MQNLNPAWPCCSHGGCSRATPLSTQTGMHRLGHHLVQVPADAILRTQTLSMERQMIIHEGADEIIAMIVTLMPTQRQRLTYLRTRSLERFWIELGRQEIIRQPLVDQYAIREWRA